RRCGKERLHCVPRRNEMEGDTLTNSGGRVLVVANVGETMEAAVAGAYEAVRKISWQDVQYRSDIAKRAFIKR
ncbi:MAG: phosphoribosylamine--glycine ligase, partial [Lentisphaeria bacterium]|nr:phosphoribosylamine--glycine ligase [Lentisphaeria bacterium]